jgi:HSP20 family molecular chaperone IbpA
MEMNMSGKTIQIQRVESLNNPLQEIEDRIRERAYQRFLQRGGQHGNDLEDWRQAAAETVEQPALTLSATDTQVIAMFALAGIDIKDVELFVTSQSILIRNGVQNELPGSVLIREFHPRQIFRVVELPQAIEPSTLRAEYHNGTLRVTAALSSAASSYRVKTA